MNDAYHCLFSSCFFSWDVVIEKSEEFDEIKHPDKLSVETMINQNFSQQVLMDNVDGVRKTVGAELCFSFSVTQVLVFGEQPSSPY